VVGIDRCSVYPGLIRFPTLRLDLVFCIYSIMVYSGLCLDRNHSICKFMNNYTFDFIKYLPEDGLHAVPQATRQHICPEIKCRTFIENEASSY
jgi:hypothetical protein